MATTEWAPEDASASRFPFIPLSKALERVRELQKNAGDHAAPVSELPALWGYTAKASGWRQTTAALKYYGLIDISGTKDRREVRLTDDARRYVLDERSEVHAELHRKFALTPRALAALWDEFKATPPADNIARSTLKIKFGYAENAAPQILAVYKANLAFAKMADHDDDSRVVEAKTPAASVSQSAPPPEPSVKVGDYVQWTSDGQDQFGTPRRVVWLSEDGAHARVFGSPTGIPVTELSVTEPPPGAPPPNVHTERMPLAQLADRPDINVLVTAAGRLEITADVDADGLSRLKAMLDKYEEILKILAPSSSPS